MVPSLPKSHIPGAISCLIYYSEYICLCVGGCLLGEKPGFIWLCAQSKGDQPGVAGYSNVFAEWIDKWTQNRTVSAVVESPEPQCAHVRHSLLLFCKMIFC